MKIEKDACTSNKIKLFENVITLHYSFQFLLWKYIYSTLVSNFLINNFRYFKSILKIFH